MNSKFTFKYEHDISDILNDEDYEGILVSQVEETHVTEAPWTDMLIVYMEFLRKTGYIFKDNVIDAVVKAAKEQHRKNTDWR